MKSKKLCKSTKVEYDGNTYGLINLPKFYIEFKDAQQRNAASDIKLEIERLKTDNIQDGFRFKE